MIDEKKFEQELINLLKYLETRNLKRIEEILLMHRTIAFIENLISKGMRKKEDKKG